MARRPADNAGDNRSRKASSVDVLSGLRPIDAWAGATPIDSTVGVGQHITNSLGQSSLGDASVVADLERVLKFKKAVEVKHEQTIKRATGPNPNPLFSHQKVAIDKLNEVERRKPSFAGLVVMPTGGGKTRTAAHWLLRKAVDQGKKVLWVAHRHELLEQACGTFQQNAYSDVLVKRKDFRCRILSGLHDQPVQLRSTDDVVFASIQSIRRGKEGAEYLQRWLTNEKELMVVIDEAHHAPARSYRHLLDDLRLSGRTFALLGLTATPFRTEETEQGHIKEIFPDDILAKFDLVELIRQGILSTPEFRSLRTEVDLFSDDRQYADELIQNGFNWERLPESIACSIGRNKERNRCIVDHYCEHREEYRPALIFALNVANAIALNELFRERQIKSDYVIGEIRRASGRGNDSPKENARKIESFRKGELDVLINVQILTEGTDVPNVQAVFLARPTTSKTLMMQMIGRGLRGKEVGGTEKTYIVSFVDDWEDKIVWVNPERLFFEPNVAFTEESPTAKPQFVQLISIEVIEAFARLMDSSLDDEAWKHLSFVERIPIGTYTLSLLPDTDDKSDAVSEVLVFDSTRQAFKELIEDLPAMLESIPSGQDQVNDSLPTELLDEIAKHAEQTYFWGLDRHPGYRPEYIRDIIQYYYTHGLAPILIEFAERPQFDVDKLAAEVLEQRMDAYERKEFSDERWDQGQNHWQAFFGFNKYKFDRAIDEAVQRKLNPDQFAKSGSRPLVHYGLRNLEDLSMDELAPVAPEHYRSLRDEVYRRAFMDGQFQCALTGKRSSHRGDFEIDHRTPRAKGGKTTLENLQLVYWWENRRKGTRE